MATTTTTTGSLVKQWLAIIIVAVCSSVLVFSRGGISEKVEYEYSYPQLLSSPSRLPINATRVARLTLKNILKRSVTANGNTAASISFVAPCGVAENVIESISTLLIATAVAKAENTEHNTTSSASLMWQFFDALFVTANPDSSSTFLPRFIYPVDMNNTSLPLQHFVRNTKIPNWFLFSGNRSNVLPLHCSENDSICRTGSGRISSLPFHATFLLEMFKQVEKQDTLHESDLDRFQSYFNYIFSYHAYLHEVVMRGCDFAKNDSKIPCYNIVHPWESLMELGSPTWDKALQPTLDHMEALNWSLNWQIPLNIQESYDFNSTTYTAMIFLTECLANQTTTSTSTSGHQYPYQIQNNGAARDFEDQLIHACPFAMLDVGYASVLAQADDDLLQIALRLSSQRNVQTRSSFQQRVQEQSWNSKISKLTRWKRQSEEVLDVLLWNPEEQSYLSRYLSPSISPPGNVGGMKMEFCNVPVANNLMVFWRDWGNDDVDNGHTPHLQEMALQLLRHDSKYSFDCGPFPLWSRGCSENTTRPLIDPRLNYFVGAGLTRNQEKMAAFGDYFTNISVRLICNKSIDGESDDYCANHATWFQEAYETDASSSDFHLDECGTSSTTTAAVLYHLLIPDSDSYRPIPPIRSSWVIILITAELMIAFTVGVTCVWLSFNLVRHENRRQEDSEALGFYAQPTRFELEEEHGALFSSEPKADEQK
jgi:hypothetical protein